MEAGVTAPGDDEPGVDTTVTAILTLQAVLVELWVVETGAAVDVAVLVVPVEL